MVRQTGGGVTMDLRVPIEHSPERKIGQYTIPERWIAYCPLHLPMVAVYADTRHELDGAYDAHLAKAHPLKP